MDTPYKLVQLEHQDTCYSTRRYYLMTDRKLPETPTNCLLEIIPVHECMERVETTRRGPCICPRVCFFARSRRKPNYGIEKLDKFIDDLAKAALATPCVRA